MNDAAREQLDEVCNGVIANLLAETGLLRDQDIAPVSRAIGIAVCRGYSVGRAEALAEKRSALQHDAARRRIASSIKRPRDR